MAWPLIDGKGLIFRTQGIDKAPLENGSILELTREKIAQQLDREARRRLAISGEELVCRYRVGLLKDRGQIADLLALTSLLAEDDPLFAAP